MKRLALVLSSLLVTAAIAQAKEVVKPVENSKEVAPVVVAPEVVKPVFRPSGYLSLQYKAYGNTEDQNDKISNNDTWNRGYNKYSRLQTYFGVQATEKFRIEGRIRDYNNLERNDGTRDNSGSHGTDTRLRFYYKHNDFFTSRLEYRDYTSDTQKFEYQARLKVYENKGALLSSLILAPKVAYYYDNNGIDGDTVLGANLEYAGNLPLGFTWDGTLYFDQHFYNDDRTNVLEKGMDDYKTFDKEFTLTWEIYLYRTWNLYTDDKTTVDFNFEGGYDPYKFRHYTRYAVDKDTNEITKLGKNTYSLYGSLTLDASHKLTEYLTLNAGVGAEYRNWGEIHEWQGSAKDWRWQPFAYAGMKVTF